MSRDLSLASAQRRAVEAALEFTSGNHKEARRELRITQREYLQLLDALGMRRPEVKARATGAPSHSEAARQFRAALNVLNSHYYAYLRESGLRAPDIVGTIPKVRALLAEFGAAAIGEPLGVTRIRNQFGIVLDLEARAVARRGAE